jgi:hypothetical protein
VTTVATAMKDADAVVIDICNKMVSGDGRAIIVIGWLYRWR